MVYLFHGSIISGNELQTIFLLMSLHLSSVIGSQTPEKESTKLFLHKEKIIYMYLRKNKSLMI